MHHLRSALLVLALVALAVHPASAQEQQYELSNFDVTVYVRADGAYEVEESITYDFQQGSFTYAYRSIVQDDGGALRDVRVTSPDTAVDSVRITEEDDVRQMRWTYPSRSEPAQFDVRYTLADAIYERGDQNVVSLDVMAKEAVVRTHDVDVRVVLPSSFDLQTNQIDLEPSAGTVQREAGRIVAHVHRDVVEEGDDLSVEVAFPRMMAGEFLPTAGDIIFAFFLVLLGTGLGGFANYRWRGPRPEVDAQGPPSDVDLPTAAVLLRNRSGQAIPAVLFDLVTRGHVTLKHHREDQLIGSKEVIHLEVHPDRSRLSPFEESVVDALRDYDTLDDFWSDTRSRRKELVQSRRDELVERGWMEAHTGRSNTLLALSVFALVGGVAAIITAKSAATFYALFGGFGVSVGSLIAGLRRRNWTETGARRAQGVRSFLEHEKSEIDRLRERNPARAAERLVESLPWLVLHDEVSKSWIEHTKEALEEGDTVPNIPDGFMSLVSDREKNATAVTAFLPVVAVMGAMESSGAGAAGAAGAAGGGAAGGAGAAGAG